MQLALADHELLGREVGVGERAELRAGATVADAVEASLERERVRRCLDGLTEEQAIREAERCLMCPKAYCVDGCPVNVNILNFIKLLREGDIQGAADSLLADNALPCVTGRVCPQETQCEQVCLRAKTGKPVRDVAAAFYREGRFDFDRPVTGFVAVSLEAFAPADRSSAEYSFCSPEAG